MFKYQIKKKKKLWHLFSIFSFLNLLLTVLGGKTPVPLILFQLVLSSPFSDFSSMLNLNPKY